MEVLVGAPGQETAQNAELIAAKGGVVDELELGYVGTELYSPTLQGKGATLSTFTGSYVIPEGQDVTRFAFEDLGGNDTHSGYIDNVSFKISSPLTYDINGAKGAAPHTSRGLHEAHLRQLFRE